MKETLGEKLKRLFRGKNDTGEAAKTMQIQPDILDVTLQDELTHSGSEMPAEGAQGNPVVLEEISEEGPRFSSKDLAQMSEGSWKPSDEPSIEELLDEVPEIEDQPAVIELSLSEALHESIAEDSAVIEELTTQMDSMEFFKAEHDEPDYSDVSGFSLQDFEEEAIEDLIHMEMAAPVEIGETGEEGSDTAETFEESSVTGETSAPEEDLAMSAAEEATESADQADIGTSDDETEPDIAKESTTATDDKPEEQIDEAALADDAGNESEIPEESVLEGSETVPEETAETESDEMWDETVPEAPETSEVSEELADLWGLNRTQEDIEKEEVRDWLKRHIIRAAVLLLLLGTISSGAYAYQQGWRINLFYEVQHTSEEGTSGNGKKKRPDSSEFFIKIKEELLDKSDEENETALEETKTDPLSDLPELEDIEIEDTDPVEEDEKEKEFVGITISKEEDPNKISEEGPTGAIEHPDQVTVEETGPVQTVEVERAVNYYLSVDGSVKEIRSLPNEIKTVKDLLDKAKVKLSGDDIVEPALTDAISEGDTVKITRILYKTVTETEVIPGQAIERMTPVLRSGRTYAINENSQADGEREVTYQEKYVNGVLESREEISSTVVKEPTDYILLVGANIAASPINGAYYTDVQILDNVPAEYSAVYSGRCTAYNFRKGAYGASGMYLSQGMVAVDPSIIPYGSLLYITNSDGSFVYGWAIACDYCEASAAGSAVVDLFFDTYRECTLFGARSLNVYVVKQLTQSDLSGYVAKEGMFRSRVPA